MLPEENKSENLWDLELDKYFLNTTSKTHERKNDKLDFTKIKKTILKKTLLRKQKDKSQTMGQCLQNTYQIKDLPRICRKENSRKRK